MKNMTQKCRCTFTPKERTEDQYTCSYVSIVELWESELFYSTNFSQKITRLYNGEAEDLIPVNSEYKCQAYVQ